MMFFLKSFLIFFVVAIKRFGNSAIHNGLYYRYGGKYLSNYVVRTKIAMTEAECAVYCLRDEECMSANYKTRGEDLGLCELNNMTLSDACTYSVDNEEFHYLQILQRVRIMYHILQ